MAHHLAGGAHFGAKQGVDAGELLPRQHRLLDEETVNFGFARQPHFFQRLTCHDTRRQLCQRHTCRLAHKGDGAAGARIDFEHVDDVIFDGILHVHQPAYTQGKAQLFGVLADDVEVIAADLPWRQHASAVTAVDARLFDVLHNAAYHQLFAITHGIDVDFVGVFKELIDQDRRPGGLSVALAGDAHGGDDRFCHVAAQALFVVHHSHGPPTEDIRRAHHHGVADAVGDGDSVLCAAGDAIGGRRNLQLRQQRTELVAVLGQVNRGGLRPQNRHALLLQARCEVERGLSAVLDDEAQDWGLGTGDWGLGGRDGIVSLVPSP